MLYTQLFKRFPNRLRASSFDVFIAFLNACHRFLKILPLPFEVLSQCGIKGGCGILPAALRVFLELRHTFWREGDRGHISSVGSRKPRVKSGLQLYALMARPSTAP
jgi:hypothetical protein